MEIVMFLLVDPSGASWLLRYIRAAQKIRVGGIDRQAFTIFCSKSGYINYSALLVYYTRVML